MLLVVGVLSDVLCNVAECSDRAVELACGFLVDSLPFEAILLVGDM